MALTSLDDYVAATKHKRQWYATAARTTQAPSSTLEFWSTLFDTAGSPRGPLAGTSTNPGVLQTDALPGYIPIPSFGGLKGYLTRVEFFSTVACRLSMFDRLWLGGAYSFNSNVSGITTPSWGSRLPNTDYSGTEIWFEAVTAFTGNFTLTVHYYNQDGVLKNTSMAFGMAPILGRAVRIPLAQGDTGVSAITQVIGSVSTVGTFNLMVLRPLWIGRVNAINVGGVANLIDTGAPEIYEDSAVFVLVGPDSTSSGLPDLGIEIAVA